MGLHQSSNMSQFQPAQGMNPTQGSSRYSQNPMQGVMQMLGMIRQMRAANGGQSPFGGKMSGQTQMARPTMPVRPMPMPSMPTPAPFQPVTQPAPRVLIPPPAPATANPDWSFMTPAGQALAAADPRYADYAKMITGQSGPAPWDVGGGGMG